MLLQILDTLAIEEPILEETSQSINLWEMAQYGGWIMVILAILLAGACYIFIARLVVIKQATQEDKSFMDRIRDYMRNNDVKSAINYCRNTNTAAARMIERGITRIGKPAAEIQTAIENTGNLEIATMEKRLPVLATIAGGAPMIGFLGTVIGMVEAFWQMSNAGGNIDISLLSGGIYQAMITTVGGLAVGIVALFGYNYLVAKIDGVVNEIEAKSLTFMDIVAAGE